MIRALLLTGFAAFVAVATISLAPSPAHAQIGNIFSDQPRPPGNVPRGQQQPVPDDEEEVPELPRGRLLPVRQRPPRRLPHLPGAQGPLWIGGTQKRGGSGIHRRQPRMQSRHADLLQQGAGIGADGGRNGRYLRQAFGQRREIKPGAADKDGKLVLRPRRIQRRPRSVSGRRIRWRRR